MKEGFSIEPEDEADGEHQEQFRDFLPGIEPDEIFPVCSEKKEPENREAPSAQTGREPEFSSQNGIDSFRKQCKKGCRETEHCQQWTKTNLVKPIDGGMEVTIRGAEYVGVVGDKIDRFAQGHERENEHQRDQEEKHAL